MTVCLKPEIVDVFSKMVISHFCHDVITQRAAASPVLDPFVLN